MKNKYQRMNKEEKKKIEAEYLKTDKGKAQIARLNRVLIIGITGVILGLALIVYAYLNKDVIWDYVSASILLIISIFFIIKSRQLKIGELNKEVLKKN